MFVSKKTKTNSPTSLEETGQWQVLTPGMQHVLKRTFLNRFCICAGLVSVSLVIT